MSENLIWWNIWIITYQSIVTFNINNTVSYLIASLIWYKILFGITRSLKLLMHQTVRFSNICCTIVLNFNISFNFVNLLKFILNSAFESKFVCILHYNFLLNQLYQKLTNEENFKFSVFNVVFVFFLCMLSMIHLFLYAFVVYIFVYPFVALIMHSSCMIISFADASHIGPCFACIWVN